MTNKEAAEILRHAANRRLMVHVNGVPHEMEPDEMDEALRLAIEAIDDLEVCRNELCLYCGQYKQRHLGACDGCRWYTPPDDYNQSQIQCHGC